jgi:hypothetical protein
VELKTVYNQIKTQYTMVKTRSWGALVKRVDRIGAMAGGGEVFFPLVAPGTKLYKDMHAVLDFLKSIDANFDSFSEEALKALELAIGSLGVLSTPLVNKNMLVTVHTKLVGLRVKVRPYLTKLILLAEEFVQFADGRREIPAPLAKFIQNLMNSGSLPTDNGGWAMPPQFIEGITPYTPPPSQSAGWAMPPPQSSGSITPQYTTTTTTTFDNSPPPVQQSSSIEQKKHEMEMLSRQQALDFQAEKNKLALEALKQKNESERVQKEQEMKLANEKQTLELQKLKTQEPRLKTLANVARNNIEDEKRRTQPSSTQTAIVKVKSAKQMVESAKTKIQPGVLSNEEREERKQKGLAIAEENKKKKDAAAAEKKKAAEVAAALKTVAVAEKKKAAEQEAKLQKEKAATEIVKQKAVDKEIKRLEAEKNKEEKERIKEKQRELAALKKKETEQMTPKPPKESKQESKPATPPKLKKNPSMKKKK